MDRQWDTYEEMATRGPARFPADARKAAREGAGDGRPTDAGDGTRPGRRADGQEDA